MRRFFRSDGLLLRGRIRHPALELSRVASFRVLLWWGVQTTLEILRIRNPDARIVQISRTGLQFPVSKWFLADEKAYCMVSPYGRKEVTIFSCLSGGDDERLRTEESGHEKANDGYRI